MKIKPNIGSADRAIRLIIAIVLILLFYTGVLTGVAGVLALLIALLVTVTSLVSFCPIYKVFNMSSVFKKEDEDVGSN